MDDDKTKFYPPSNNKPASERDTTDGTIGFSPQLAGHAKAQFSNTSSFGTGSVFTLPTKGPEDAGLDEGKLRQPTTSAISRVVKEKQ